VDSVVWAECSAEGKFVWMIVGNRNCTLLGVKLELDIGSELKTRLLEIRAGVLAGDGLIFDSGKWLLTFSGCKDGINE